MIQCQMHDDRFPEGTSPLCRKMFLPILKIYVLYRSFQQKQRVLSGNIELAAMGMAPLFFQYSQVITTPWTQPDPNANPNPHA